MRLAQKRIMNIYLSLSPNERGGYPSSQFVKSYMRCTPGQPGICGWRFFIVSYPLLGIVTLNIIKC